MEIVLRTDATKKFTVLPKRWIVERTFSWFESFRRYTINNIRQLRADFGSYLLLELEFLIASDILRTVVDPTLDELANLGGVVVVRTVLSVFLNKEIKELAENESSKF